MTITFTYLKESSSSLVKQLFSDVDFVSDVFHSMYFLSAVSNHMFTSEGSTGAAILRILNRYSLSFSRLPGHYPSNNVMFNKYKIKYPLFPQNLIIFDQDAFGLVHF